MAGVIKMVLALRHELLPPHAARGRAVAARGLVGGSGAAADRAGALARAAGGRAGPGCPRSGSAAPTPTSSWKKPRPVTARSRRGQSGRRRCSAAGVGRRGWCRGGPRQGVRRRPGGCGVRWRRARAWVRRDVGWSLATTRSVFEHRAVVIGRDREELAAGLAAVAAGEPAAGVVTGPATAGAGQGGVRVPGAGRAVGGDGPGAGGVVPGVRGAAGRVRCGAGPVRGLGSGGGAGRCAGAPLDRADVVQPALWAVMVSLAAVWQAAGVSPGCGGGPFAGRDRRGDGGRDLVAGRRGPGGGVAQPGAGGAGRARAGWCRWPGRPRRCGSGSLRGGTGCRWRR